MCLALLVAVVSAGAWYAFPVWDDAAVWLQLDELGAQGIADGMRDRPFLGFLWAWQAEAGILWPTSLLLHMALLLGQGLLTAAIWSRFFPSWRQFRWVPAVLAVSHMHSQVGVVLLNTTQSGLLATVPTYAAFWLLLSRPTKKSRDITRLVLAAVCLLFGMLLSEYPIPAVAALAMILLVRAGRVKSERRSWLFALFWLLLFSAVGYFAYATIADATVRLDVRPGHVSGVLSTSGLESIPMLLWSAFDLVIGAPARALAAPTDTISLLSAAMGLMALPLLLMSCFGAKVDPENSEVASGGDPRAFTTPMVLVGAVILGLVPVILMGRLPSEPPLGSRFVVPLIPLLAIVTLAGPLAIIRDGGRRAVVVLLGFAAVFSTVNVTLRVLDHRAETVVWEEQLRVLADNSGLTIVVFDDLKGPLRRTLDYELTLRLSESWTTEQRSRFWVFPDEDVAFEAMGRRGGCHQQTGAMSLSFRGITRQGLITHLYWATPRSDGLLVEPYCLQFADGAGDP